MGKNGGVIFWKVSSEKCLSIKKRNKKKGGEFKKFFTQNFVEKFHMRKMFIYLLLHPSLVRALNKGLKIGKGEFIFF